MSASPAEPQAKTAHHEAQQALNRAYVHAIEAAGGVPIILPVTRDADIIARYLGVVDGLLLSGGVDIGPEWYDAPPHPKLGPTDADRDATEIPLACAAVAQDVPIFGICRGLQVLNVALGGSLYQDLPAEHPSLIAHQQTDRNIPRSQTVHNIALAPEGRLAGILGPDPMPVNSLHHQAIHRLAPGMEITARAADGVIEAVEMPGKYYVVAVQFHPEETAPHEERSRRMFPRFRRIIVNHAFRRPSDNVLYHGAIDESPLLSRIYYAQNAAFTNGLMFASGAACPQNEPLRYSTAKQSTASCKSTKRCVIDCQQQQTGEKQMEPFVTISGRVAPLDRANVDTDQIIPKQFLKRIERTGFGQFLFFDWRYLADGTTPDPAFELNAPQYLHAPILVAGKNFGCGSSREHAPLGPAGLRRPRPDCALVPPTFFTTTASKTVSCPSRCRKKR